MHEFESPNRQDIFRLEQRTERKRQNDQTRLLVEIRAGIRGDEGQTLVAEPLCFWTTYSTWFCKYNTKNQLHMLFRTLLV